MFRSIFRAERLAFFFLLVATLTVTGTTVFAQEIVDGVLEVRRSELSEDDAQLARIRQLVPNQRKALSKDLSALHQRYEVLLARQRLIGNNPRELRDLALLLNALEQEIKQRAGKASGTADNLQGIAERAAELQKNVQGALLEASDAETRKALANLINVAARVEREAKGQRAILAPSVRKANQLGKMVGDSRTALETKLPSAWSEYFLQPDRSYTSIAGLRSLYASTTNSIRDIRSMALPDDGMDREDVAPWIGKAVGTSVLAFLLGWALLRRARSRWPAHTPTSLRAPLLWIALGLGVLVALMLSPSVHMPLLLLGGRVLLLWGTMQAIWRFRRAEEPKVSRNPLGLLWLGYVVAELVSLGGVPSGFVSLVTPLVLLQLSYLTSHRGKALRPCLERHQLIASSWAYGLLSIPSILGWGNLMTLAVSLWFVVCLLLQSAVVLHRMLAAWGHRSPKTGTRAILGGIALGIGFPIIWFGAASAWIQWLAPRIGRPHLYFEVLSYDIGIGKVSVSLLRLAAIVVGFFVCRAALAVANAFIHNAYETRDDTGPGAADAIGTVVLYSAWSAFAVLTLSVLGVNLTSLAVIAGGLSVGIGFGMQNIVNNFVGGMILLIGRSVQRGDVIDVDGIHGVVQRVTIRNTVVQSYDNSTLFVPNSQLVSGKLTNWTHRDRRVRRELIVGVAYGSDTALVQRLLLEAAHHHYRIEWDPEPAVLFWDFGASSLEFRMRVWVDDYEHALIVLSDLRTEVDRLFREHGIEIAFPQQDIHVRSAPGLEETVKHLKVAGKEPVKAGPAAQPV